MAEGVSLKDYADAQVEGLFRLGVVVTISLLILIAVLDMKEAKANKVAFAAAEAKGIQHNGVLDMLQKWIRTTITWPMLLAGLTGAALAVGIYVAINGSG